MKSAFIAASLAAAFCIHPVQAAEIDAQGARALQESLSRFFPEDANSKGFLTVEPTGDIYRLIYDFSKIANQTKPNDPAADQSRLTMQAMPIDNGLWRIEGNDSVAFDVTEPGPNGKSSETSYSLNNLAISGIFDPAIGYFQSGELRSGPLRSVWKSGRDEVETSVASARYELTSRQGAASDIVDIHLTGSASRFYQNYITGDDGSVRLRAESVDYISKVDGIVGEKIPAVVNLSLAMFSDSEWTEAEAARLKKVIETAMPSAGSMFEEIQFNQFSANVNSFGEVNIDRLGYDGSVSGSAEAARIDLGLDVDNVSASAALLPPAYAKLLPEKAQVRTQFGANLLQVIDVLASDIISKSTPLTDADMRMLVNAVLKDGRGKLDIPKIIVKSPLYDIEAFGNVEIDTTKSGQYRIAGSILARDIDKLIQYLKASSDPQFNQILLPIMVARGMGKADPDGRLRWDVEFEVGKSLTVNGVKLM